MDAQLRVLMIDASSGYYRVVRFPVGAFFGPVGLGLHLAGRHNSLNFGTGLLAGSIFPGSNRLIFTGFSPCWGGFYVSSMGGAGLPFDNLGVNLVAIVGRAATPSVLYLNRIHGEEIQVALDPIDLTRVWREGRTGVYGVMEHVIERFGDRYEESPRVLAVGPAAAATDMGAIGSAPIAKGKITHVDTWAGRGGLGTKLLREHGIGAVIYGGTFLDEDFRDRKVADTWFLDRYQKKLAAKDFETTTKYRFDPAFGTGGTFGVNYATVGGRIIAFNYRSIYWEESERVELHQKFILDHYLKQFNEETIATKSQKNCGEPCAAVCKKMHGEFKKDYEPYQTMGPLVGVFDQRAAERLNHRADSYGFDAISAGGVLAWLMENVAEGRIAPEELGLKERPVFDPKGFSLVEDSAHNANIGIALLDGIVAQRGLLDLHDGARRAARHLARERGRAVLDPFVYTAFGRRGWMVPNQYWTPGVLSPMAIMGKYYMHYGAEFLPPRELGRKNAERLKKEFIMDELGTCRFHRGWAEDIYPDVVEHLWGMKTRFLADLATTASRINSRNASVLWEPARNGDIVHTFLKRRRDVEGDNTPALLEWIDRFERDPEEAAMRFWFETLKGIHESLREFG